MKQKILGAVQDGAKIQQYQAITGPIGLNQVIAEVGIGLQHAPVVKLEKKQLQHGLGQGISPGKREPLHGGVGYRLSLHILQREHPRAAVIFVNRRGVVTSPQSVQLCQPAAYRPGKVRFPRIVNFMMKITTHGLQPFVHIASRRQPPGQAQHADHRIEIAVDDLSEPGILHLQHNLLASRANTRPMNLGQGCGGEGLLLDIESIDPCAEVLPQNGLHSRPGQWLGSTTQLVQGLGQGRWQEMLAQQGEHLANFDVGPLELAQLVDESARLAACKFRVPVGVPQATARQHLGDGAVDCQGAAGPDTSQGGGDSTRYSATL